jgi:hypothetical protein
MKYKNLFKTKYLLQNFRYRLQCKPFSSFVGLDVFGGSGSGNNYNERTHSLRNKI